MQHDIARGEGLWVVAGSYRGRENPDYRWIWSDYLSNPGDFWVRVDRRR